MDDTTAPNTPAPAGKGYGFDEEEKDHDYGVTAGGPDAMTHLLMAYRLMLDYPECEPLLAPLMAIVHAKQELMTTKPGEPEVLVVATPDEDGYEATKEIREEDGEWCVYSADGDRSFGCYPTEEKAQDRLSQIEAFSRAALGIQHDRVLSEWHSRLHALERVSDAHITLHNLIEDTLEGRGVAPPYDLGDSDAKLVMLSSGVVKQSEQRYTLGPVYVPGEIDAHGEFTDSETLQLALWNWVRKGDRTIYLQHSDRPAGEMVEVLTWPFEIQAALSTPGQGVVKHAFPADTPFMGVVWEPWAWEMVKAGDLRGYSIGGRARRVELDLLIPASA